MLLSGEIVTDIGNQNQIGSTCQFIFLSHTTSDPYLFYAKDGINYLTKFPLFLFQVMETKLKHCFTSNP